MSAENPLFMLSLAPIDSFWLMMKVGILFLGALYFVFSLIIVRQVSLMSEVLITEVSPLLRAFTILHAGLALGIIILFIGLLF